MTSVARDGSSTPGAWERAPTPGRRVSPLRVLTAFVRRDWQVAVSYRFGFVATIGQSMVSLFFLYFLGKLVAPGAGTGTATLRAGYFSFAVVGTSLLGLVNVGLSTVSDRLRADQTTGTFETLLAAPTPGWLTVVSGAAYPILFSAAVSLLTLAIALGAFGMRLHASLASGAVAAGALLLTVALFCALGVGLASAVVLFKSGVPLVPFASTVLMLLGGVYYPVHLLPAPLRVLSYLLPFTWALDVIRRAILLAQVPWAELGWLLLSAAVLVPMSLGVFAAALNRARRLGTLGQY